MWDYGYQVGNKAININQVPHNLPVMGMILIPCTLHNQLFLSSPLLFNCHPPRAPLCSNQSSAPIRDAPIWKFWWMRKTKFQCFLFQFCNVIIHKMMKANLASYEQKIIVSDRGRPTDRGVTRIRRSVKF